MTVYSGTFTTPGTSADIDLELEVTVTSQSIANNSSSLSWTLRMVKGAAGFPYHNSRDCIGYASVGGTVFSKNNLNYNFPSGAYTITVASGSKTITHEADGKKTIAISASYDGHSPIGTASLSTSLALPTINRNLLRVGVDGEWVSCEVSVGINGSWVPAQPHAGVDDEWVLNDAA